MGKLGKALVLLSLGACAATQPSGISLRPIPKPTPPNPDALSHFVEARLHEMRGRRDQAIVSLKAAISIDTTSATLYGALARNLAARNRYREVVDPARRSLALDPENLTVRWLYYESLLGGTGDTTQALAQLERIARVEPQPIKAFDQMLKIHDARGNAPEVIRTLDRIATLPNLDDRAKLIAAQNYQQRGANLKAEQMILDVLKRSPDRADAWVKLANLQVIRGDTLAGGMSLRNAIAKPSNRVNARPIWAQLIKIYAPVDRMRALLTESPPDTMFQEQLAEVYRQFATTGNASQASQLLERSDALFNNLTQLLPNRADLFAKRGELLIGLNRPADARQAFAQAGKLDDRPEYQLGKAHAHLYERNFNAAIEILEQIQPNVEPGSEFHEKTILSLGNAYTATGKNSKARELFMASIKANPENTSFPYELGETYARDEAWQEAVDVFRTLLPRVEEKSGALGLTLYGLARSLERSGAFDESARTFERLLTLHPNHADALNYLGYMFAERGIRLGEAENFIKRALESDPDNGAYLDSLGWVLYQQGRYHEALVPLERASHLAADDPDATIEEHLGDVINDLQQRRAIITNTEIRGGVNVLTAEAPLASMFGYSAAVRSVSQGRASFTMAPLKYGPAPAETAEAYV